MYSSITLTSKKIHVKTLKSKPYMITIIVFRFINFNTLFFTYYFLLNVIHIMHLVLRP